MIRTFLYTIGGLTEENNTKLTFPERFVEIIIKPKKTFEYLAAQPDWQVPLAFIIITEIIMTASIELCAGPPDTPWFSQLSSYFIILIPICQLWILNAFEIYILVKAVKSKFNLFQAFSITGCALFIPTAAAIGFEVVKDYSDLHFHIDQIKLFCDSYAMFLYIFASYNLFLTTLGVHTITKNFKKTIFVAAIHFVLLLVFVRPTFNGPDVRLKNHYKNGKLDGVCRQYYLGGNLKEEDHYINGEEKGPRKSYYNSGKLESEKRNGIFKSYYENGKLEEYYPQDGIAKEYYENGNLKNEQPWKNDTREGICKEYYENGNLKCEMPWKNGRREGNYKEYYENGQIKEEINHKNGEKEGIEKWYYPNGTLKQEIFYKGGYREGIGKTYYESGTLKSVGTYHRGNLWGSVKTYDENGKLKKDTAYKYGLNEQDGWRFWVTDALDSLGVFRH